ncbi:MAG: RnfABCDGE type electron transport complex subunit D [Tissierellia bacterium]|nr:RnfABCDGE type electron transport complex subunit D [Tissierellia bacterium]
MEDNKKTLVVSASPHIKSNITTQSIMLDVIIAMIPMLIASVYLFGVRALILTLVTVVSSVLAEYLIQKLMNRPVRISDLSAVVTGMLLAFNLPFTFPYWMAAFGAIFAIVVVKELFGGIGNNFMNPALAARAVLLASWPSAMGKFSMDAVSVATPLSGKPFEMMDLFLGNIPGVMGEVSKIAILIGAAYLLIKGVIKIKMPAIYVGTCAILFLLVGYDFEDMIMQILSGGLLLGGFFMLTDYSSSPNSDMAQTIYAFGAGLLTVVIRKYGGYPEGVSYAILLMNTAAPLLDKLLKQKTFGREVAKNE